MTRQRIMLYEHLPAKKVTISEHTRDGFQRVLDLHIYSAIGDKKLPEVTSAKNMALLLSKQKNGQATYSVISRGDIYFGRIPGRPGGTSENPVSNHVTQTAYFNN